jgi:hypothetical protein
MHRTTRRWVTGAAAVAAGAVMLGPVTAFAQTDDPGGSTTTTAPDTTTANALPDWMTSVLDRLVEAGTITQAQADAVTKALQDARPAIDRHWGGPRGGFGRIGIALDEAAKALRIDLDELRTELRNGKTLAELATEHGVDVQQVIDALKAAAESRLDQAVADGRLTQEQADDRLAELTERLEDFVNEPLPTKDWSGRRGGRHHDESTDDKDEGEDTTPDSTAPPTTSPGGS